MIANCKFALRHLLILMSLVAIPGVAAAGFDWNIEHQGSVNDFFEIEAFHTFVTNNGATADVVTVTMVKDVPGDWVASLCEEELCYAPFILEIDLVLDPGQTTELIIDITPVTNEGKGSAHISLVSANDPQDTEAATFSVLTTGRDVLFISGGDTGSSTALYTTAITSTGKTYATWDAAGMGKASSTDLANFETVVWGTGATLTGIDAADMTNLTTYLNNGGHLFLSGQNLTYAYCNPASPFYDTVAHDWFKTTLGVDFVSFAGSTDFVGGEAGQPVFDGTTYFINGGDGANNNTTPDVIAATGNGVNDLDFSGGGTALVRADQGAAKTVYASFGFEGINSASARADFMNKILTWFANQATAVGDDIQPLFARRAMASPNPFNPQTSIHFEVGGSRSVAAEVTIYDLQGRAVRHLFQGTVAPGPRSVTWNGRDDNDRNLATGVYLARVNIAREQQIVKMTLAK